MEKNTGCVIMLLVSKSDVPAVPARCGKKIDKGDKYKHHEPVLFPYAKS